MNARVITVYTGITALAAILLMCGGQKPVLKGYQDDVPEEIRALIEKKYNQGIYAVGSSRGPTQEVARNKAVMQARAEIARQFKTEVGVLQKDYEESVNNKALGEYSQVMEIFSTLEINGSFIAKSMIRMEDEDIYAAKVLVVLSAEQLKRMLDARMQSFTSFKASKAYKELEKRVEKEQALERKGNFQ